MKTFTQMKLVRNFLKYVENVFKEINYTIANLGFQALNKESQQSYLPLAVKQLARVLSGNSSGNLTLELSQIQNTFQHSAARVFNNIPSSSKYMNFKGYETSLNKHFQELSRIRIGD